MRALHILASAGALLVLTVVAASAAIRLGGEELGAALVWVRGVHRVAASAAALVVFVLQFLSLKKRILQEPVLAAFALTLALSVVGWIAGTTPPPAAALFNQMGGIALAGLLAWIWGSGFTKSVPSALSAAALLLATLQAVFGGALAALGPDLPAALLIAHAASGLAAAALLAALGWRYGIAAAAAPVLGTLAVVLPSVAAQSAHALAAALLVCAAAHARARRPALDAHQGCAGADFQNPGTMNSGPTSCPALPTR